MVYTSLRGQFCWCLHLLATLLALVTVAACYYSIAIIQSVYHFLRLERARLRIRPLLQTSTLITGSPSSRPIFARAHRVFATSFLLNVLASASARSDRSARRDQRVRRAWSEWSARSD